MRSFFLKVFLAAMTSCCAASVSHSASTEWQDLGGGEARLIANLDLATNQVSGAVEVKLKPGWSTYWRYPGSSGIPPRFDFSGSEYFKEDAVHFPVPKHIKHKYGSYAGYKNKVTFPFNGQLSNGSSGKIDLQLLIGVCEEICIPAQASMSINLKQLMQSDPVSQQTIQFAKLLLPKQQSSKGIILNVANDDGKKLLIDVAHPAQFGEPSLFVEGPQNWYLKPAELVGQSETTARFSLDISRIPDGANPENQKLRYTLVTGQKGIETER